MSGVLLPLFPLNVVLFPDSILPLHIFEERYKQLINECLSGEKEFGINLVQENVVAKVGCTAQVASLLKRYEDGRMDIAVTGKRRYTLKELVESPSLYSVGRVEFLQGNDEVPDVKLAAEAVQLHNQLVEIVYRDASFQVEYEVGEGVLSFKLAQKAGMELALRQQLLDSNSENERLSILHAYFIEVVPKLERLEEVERVIRTDGYIVN